MAESVAENRQRFADLVGDRVLTKPTRSPRDAYDLASLPLLVGWIFDLDKIDPAYGMTRAKLLRLAARMYDNTRKLQTGISYKAHLAMAAKVLEMPPSVEGAIVECGCWCGGSTANLSLIADLVGRELIVYDSFEGLPPHREDDRNSTPGFEGVFGTEVEAVRRNVARHGKVDRVSFRKGWFADTLGDHTEPIVLAFVDVDYHASLEDCVINLWPHLTAKGYLFIDEYALVDYCALFYSERFWTEHFDCPPPGMVGAGSGIGLGQYYTGPFNWTVDPRSVAYTRRNMYGQWDHGQEGADQRRRLRMLGKI